MTTQAAVEQQQDVASLIDLYLLRCQVEGKSPNTITAYRETLTLFQRIAREEGFPEGVRDITPVHIYAYLGRIGSNGVSLETRHRRHREVRFLFSWLKRMGYIEESPFVQIKNVRLPQKIVQPYTAEEIGRLLACCDSRYCWGSRNRAMILVLLDTGVRRTELVSLDLADLDLEAQRLRVLHGKGNKQRVVRFGARAKEAVEDYLERFRGTESGPLFLSRDGKRMSSHSVLIFLRRLGKVGGVEKVKVHRFRHTFATWAIENEARELDVQYLLGHSTPAMVRRYSATYDAEKAARAHERFSPADRMGERLG
jgi:site-specific recombinase XerD